MPAAVVGTVVVALATAPSALANDAPVCSSSPSATLFADASVQVRASCTDTDPLTYTVVGQPQHGSVSPSTAPSAGPFVYKPQAGYSGTDSFTVRANDGELDSAAVQTINITVNPKVAPFGCGSQPSPYPVRANGARMIPLTLMCSSNTGLPPAVTIVTQPAHGTLSGPPESPIYTPAAGYTGSDEITFRITNSLGSSSDLTWALQVADGAGLAPQCFGSAPQYVRNDAPVNVNLSCFDEDIEQAQIAIVAQPQHGTLSTVTQGAFSPVAGALMPAIGRSTATVTYTADAGYTGPDSFSIAGDDGRQVSATQTVSLNVANGATNHAPVCLSNDAVVTAGPPSPVLAGCSDPDGDTVTVATTQAPTHGSLGAWAPSAFNGGRTATFTPDAGFTGADRFSVQATDARGATSAVASIPLSVLDVGTMSPASATLTCAARLLQVTRNTTLTTQHIDCFTGVGAPGILSIAAGPAHGSASMTPAGELRYKPDTNYTGPDTMTMHGAAGSTTLDYVLLISVTSNAKTKILSGPPASSTDTAQTFSLYAEPGVALTCALSNSSASAPTPCAGTKSYSATPAGDHVLTVTATDGQGRTSTDTYAFTVTAPPSGGGGGGGAASGSGGSAATGSTSDAPSTTPSSAPDAGTPAAPSQTPTTGASPASADRALKTLVGARPALETLRKSGRVSLRFAAPAPGQLSLRWTVADPTARGGRVVLATASTRVAQAGSINVTVRLTSAGRALLRRGHGSLRVSAKATFQPDGRAAVTQTGAFTLRRS